MPTYEYECPAGHRYEKREGFDAPATQRCAQCRRTARRVLSAPSILFKGSGFYITDSRKPAPADSASESTSDGKGEPKPDAKPDAKPAASPEKPAASSPEKPPATPTKDAKPAPAS